MSNTAGVTRDSQGRVHAIKGQPSGGAYVTDPDRRRDGPTLVVERQAEPQRWPEAPNTDQMKRAGNEALRRSIMSDTPNFDIAAEQKRIAYRLADQESCYEAFRAGQPHADDAAFAALWDGDSSMNSRAAVTARLDELTEQRALIESGKAHPGVIIGRRSGDGDEDRAMAMFIADEHIATLNTAMECGGRNLTLNQIRVCQTRTDENEAAVPF